MDVFERVVDEYDAARPGYPSGVFDALEPLSGTAVLEGGAGTGIASRDLLGRGANLTVFDIGPTMLGRALAQTPSLRAVIADGVALPFPDRSFDLICFAQSWHWLDPEMRCRESSRVLRAGGRWAAWWSHSWADEEDWFAPYWAILERTWPADHPDYRDIDWGAGLDDAYFGPVERTIFPWIRTCTVDHWLTDQASHSYVAALAKEERGEILAELREILDRSFPDGNMEVRYETRLWTAPRA